MITELVKTQSGWDWLRERQLSSRLDMCNEIIYCFVLWWRCHKITYVWWLSLPSSSTGRQIDVLNKDENCSFWIQSRDIWARMRNVLSGFTAEFRDIQGRQAAWGGREGGREGGAHTFMSHDDTWKFSVKNSSKPQENCMFSFNLAGQEWFVFKSWQLSNKKRIENLLPLLSATVISWESVLPLSTRITSK